jgi:hypothetical protein
VGLRIGLEAAGRRKFLPLPEIEPRPFSPSLLRCSIVMEYGMDDRVQFLLGEYHSLQTGSGAHTASNPVGTGTFSIGLKRLGREADLTST